MLLKPAEKYRKLIPLLSHAVRTATQISAYFGSLTQLISRQVASCWNKAFSFEAQINQHIEYNYYQQYQSYMLVVDFSDNIFLFLF